jgi:hypothetical protein
MSAANNASPKVPANAMRRVRFVQSEFVKTDMTDPLFDARAFQSPQDPSTQTALH